MNDKTINFEEAKAPHVFARKEQKLKALRNRFKAAHPDSKPKKKTGRSKPKKR